MTTDSIRTPTATPRATPSVSTRIIPANAHSNVTTPSPRWVSLVFLGSFITQKLLQKYAETITNIARASYAGRSVYIQN